MKEVYRPETKYPETSVRQLLNIPQVKAFSDNQLIKCYEELNVDTPFLTKEKKDLYFIAKKKEDVKSGLSVIHSMQEDMGLNQKVKITEKRQINSNLQDNFNKAVKETRTIVVETSKKGDDGE